MHKLLNGAMSDPTTELAIVRPTDYAESTAVGRYGYPVEMMESGDLIEWIPNRDNPASGWPALVQRNGNSLSAAYGECIDRVWWNKHQRLQQSLERGEQPLSELQTQLLELAKEAAARIEDRYGRESLSCSDYQLGIWSGCMSALRWVTGEKWEGSLDI